MHSIDLCLPGFYFHSAPSLSSIRPGLVPAAAIRMCICAWCGRQEVERNSKQRKQKSFLSYLGCVWPSQWWPPARGQQGRTVWSGPWCRSQAWWGQAWHRSSLAQLPTGETLSLWLQVEEQAGRGERKQKVKGLHPRRAQHGTEMDW